MSRRLAVFNGLTIAVALSLVVSTGCDQNQQMQTWNAGGWNLFGPGTYDKNYNLQYPIGDTQVVHPAAVGLVNTNTKSSSYSRNLKLQYAVGQPQPVNQSPAPSWFSRSKPRPQPVQRHTASDAGATTYTKRFDLQYPIGRTQGLNGHSVAPSSRTSHYQRNYNLQYPIGSPQAVRAGHSTASFTRRPSEPAQRSNRSTYRSSNRTAMRRAGNAGGSYVVRPGDTLTSIARAQYGPRNAKRWPEILDANRNVINRADEIAPGMRLRIP